MNMGACAFVPRLPGCVNSRVLACKAMIVKRSLCARVLTYRACVLCNLHVIWTARVNQFGIQQLLPKQALPGTAKTSLKLQKARSSSPWLHIAGACDLQASGDQAEVHLQGGQGVLKLHPRCSCRVEADGKASCA